MLPTSPRDPASRSSQPRRSQPRRRPALSLLFAAVVALAGLGARPESVAADGVTPLPDITFYGRGYGHGVGMSQYGARGRALAGQLAPAILAHYYPRTTLGARAT